MHLVTLREQELGVFKGFFIVFHINASTLIKRFKKTQPHVKMFCKYADSSKQTSL